MKQQANLFTCSGLRNQLDQEFPECIPLKECIRGGELENLRHSVPANLFTYLAKLGILLLPTWQYQFHHDLLAAGGTHLTV
jgi:hypothetical protein